MDYEALLPFAQSECQAEAIKAIIQAGSHRKAAKLLGVHPTNVDRAVTRVRRNATVRGYSPQDDALGRSPEGYHVKGKSTLYDADGTIRAQWVKTAIDHEKNQEAVREAIGAFCEEVGPVSIPKGPRRYDRDIIPWYQIGDAHLGMLAHDAETGANFDLKIAERELMGAFSILFDEAPAGERCVINDLGDFTHYENLAAVTEASGNPLDYDGRFPKMIRVYSRVFRAIVDMALSKYRYVDVIVNQGNHSRTNDWWMAELLRAAYAKTDRLKVLDNDSVFVPYRMGNTFVMVHHGDKTKPDHLSKVMSTHFRQDWGETEHHYIDVGHLHHRHMAIEAPGCVVECWNTLAGLDKWAHDAGYKAIQSITRVDRSKVYGEVGRRTLPVQEIRNRLMKGRGVYVPPERREVFTV